jgi:DNA-binding response OmpR family regulator
MGVPPPAEPKPVQILVLEDDPRHAAALRNILDSESWHVRIVTDSRLLLTALKSGEWSLVVLNVELFDLESPAFVILKELHAVSPEEGGRLRVLCLAPEMADNQLINTLETSRLPYVTRPYNLHELLEKVSDLLVEVKAINAPIRQVRYEFGGLRKKKKEAARSTSMFASRESYSYSDEELAEYERQEGEAAKSRRKPSRNLGNPNT